MKTVNKSRLTIWTPLRQILPTNSGISLAQMCMSSLVDTLNSLPLLLFCVCMYTRDTVCVCVCLCAKANNYIAILNESTTFRVRNEYCCSLLYIPKPLLRKKCFKGHMYGVGNTRSSSLQENYVTYTGVCFCFIYDEPSVLSQINLLQPYFPL